MCDMESTEIAELTSDLIEGLTRDDTLQLLALASAGDHGAEIRLKTVDAGDSHIELVLILDNNAKEDAVMQFIGYMVPSDNIYKAEMPSSYWWIVNNGLVDVPAWDGNPATLEEVLDQVEDEQGIAGFTILHNVILGLEKKFAE